MLRSKKLFKLGLMFIDGITLFGIFFMLSLLRTDVDFTVEYWYRAILPMLLTWLILDGIGAYSPDTDMRSLPFTSQYILAMIIIVVSTIVVVYLFSYKPALQFSRSVLPTTYLLFLTISLSVRRWIHSRLADDRRKRFYLVLGTDETAQELYRTYTKTPKDQHVRFADLNGKKTGSPISGEGSPMIEGNVLTTLRSMETECDGIILTEDKTSLSDTVFRQLVELHFHNVPLIPSKLFFEENFRKVPLFILNRWWLFEGDLLLVRNPWYTQLKRLLDLAIAIINLIVFFPLMILIGILIRVESRGPIIFRQTRIGKNELPFTMYKFRTMVHGAGNAGDKYVREHDPRVTRVGRILRLTRLDELPQFWNVLKGEMSVIGPRAEWFEVAREYEQKIEYYHFRHLVKPGITGWAQVNYSYGENINDTIQKLQYDLYYISHYSLLLDIDIMLKTVHIMMFGKGQ
ncbi:MAG TPA: sugar transferase [Bacteroidota bacterium]|nr:sugar transferase [Bacteroidota bacterium]